MKQIIRLIGMIVVGLSVVLISKIGIWFMFPWLIGWFIYDLNVKY